MVPKPQCLNERSIKEKVDVEPAAMVRHEQQRQFIREQDTVSKCLTYSIPECRKVREARVHYMSELWCIKEFDLFSHNTHCHTVTGYGHGLKLRERWGTGTCCMLIPQSV